MLPFARKILLSPCSLKLKSDDSPVLGVVEGHKFFLWGMWSIVKRKKIIEMGSFPWCGTPEREFETA